MSQVIHAYNMIASGGAATGSTTLSLLDFLSTTIVLDHVVAHLPLASLFALSATSRSFQRLILNTPGVFRYLDLSRCRGAQIGNSDPIDQGGNVWRAERMDEALTEDDFYNGPLRGIFFANLRRRDLLRDVQVMVLDGLSVTMELINEIITSDSFSVKLLSVVGCRNLNERKLMQLLRFACRPERPQGTPRLKGIYLFPKREVRKADLDDPNPRNGVLSVTGAQLGGTLTEAMEPVPNDEAWWHGCGRVIDLPKRHPLRLCGEEIIDSCKGVISFDAILCPNKRHDAGLTSGPYEVRPLATISLGPQGCASCGVAPQLEDGPLRWGVSPTTSFPLVSPLPHAGKLELAAAPPSNVSSPAQLIVSCEECLKGRWCTECNRYWCRNCCPFGATGERRTVIDFDENNREVVRVVEDGQVAAGQTGMGLGSIKVFNGFCTERCLVKAEMDGAGAGGMWG